MDIRVLNYFLTVAQEENITRAAALLHITQPTLSRQLMQLEEELGVKLFTRSRHRILLTRHGMLLRRRAQELISLADKTKQELSQEEVLSGEIAIGSGEYQNSRLLAQILGAFRRRHPDITFHLYSGHSDNIKERIERGILDVGFLLEPVDVSKYEFIRSPRKEEWCILACEESDLASRDSVTPKDLADRPLIFTRRDLIKEEIVSWFGQYSDHIRIAANGNLPYNMAQLCKAEIGFLLTLKLDCSYEGMRYIPLSPKLESSTVLVWKKNQAMPPAVRAFVDFARQCLNPEGMAGSFSDASKL